MTLTKMAHLSRSYAQGRFGLIIDMGVDTTAWVQSVSGGGVRAEISTEESGAESHGIKSVQSQRIMPIEVKQAIGAGGPLYNWIKRSWSREPARFNGSIQHANFNFEVMVEQEFQDALLSKVTFPALDAASKEAGYLEVSLQPEMVRIRRMPPGIKLAGFKEDVSPKRWTSSSFRVSLFRGGLELNCRGVRKVDSFTIVQRLEEHRSGDESIRFPLYEPCGIEFPDLKLTVSAGMAGDFFDWYEEFLNKGASSAADEMIGYLEYTDPTTEKALFTIYLDRVGIKSLELAENVGAESIHTAHVELYVGLMSLDVANMAR